MGDSLKSIYEYPSRERPLEGCPVFPADNIWNTSVAGLPLDPTSSAFIKTIGPTRGLHPDFGSGTWNGGPIGIPYDVVDASEPKVNVSFDYADESDAGPYPIPPDALIEGGSQSSGDRHVLVLDRASCILYELFSAYPQPDGSWQAGSGAIFDLNSNALRRSGWTSADAAGLPILSGLVRYDEVAAGEIKTYGLILADNGSAWYISGVPDSRWDNDMLVSELAQVKGSDFEAVDVSSLIVNPDSGLAVQGTGAGGGSSNNGGSGGGSAGSSGGGGCFISFLLSR